ncbi:MAG: transposase, partial [Pseudomonadota bacterium]
FENGKQVRVDSTVADTNIEYPTDSKLLYDCIRVIDREFKEAREVADKKSWRLTSFEQVKEAKSLRYKINNSKNDEGRLPFYNQLLKIAKTIRRDFPSIIEKIEKVLRKSESSALKSSFEQLRNVNFFLGKIIYQTEQRVLNGKIIPSPEKIVSILEPHTDIIVKDRRETQFGHKIFVTSGVSNMVLHCDIPKGNVNDSDMFSGTIEAIKDSFGKYPVKVSADGGFASEENIFASMLLGVKDICFPKRCNMEIKDMVKSEWVYDKLLNWRAGIEAVISFLKRCFGISKSSWSGFDGFKRYVRCGIASYNLLLLARNELMTN